MRDGWIGSWSPGIGDPTVGGWVTVLLYAWVAWMSLHVLRGENRRQLILSANERTVWRWMLAGMIALGINKQLDLQSGLTELARVLAHEQVEHGHRGERCGCHQCKAQEGREP